MRSNLQISRRRLMTLGSAALGLGLVPQAKANPLDSIPSAWDEEIDVVVIGSGFAGLAAAIEARKAGAQVVVLEKMRTPGGNSIINGGILAAPGCPQQKKHGIQDSAELLAADIKRAGLNLNYPDKVKFITERALDNYWWCVNELGVKFNEQAIGQEGGHSVPRYVKTANSSGSGIVMKELDKCKELGVPVRLRTYVEHIYRCPQSGTILGIRVREKYRFPKADSGVVKNIRTRKALILCYGGFGADVKFRTMYDPRLTGEFESTNQPGATGELWADTAAIGCAQIQQDWIQCGPWCSPKEKGMGMAVAFNQSSAAEFGLWVNSRGERFVNELANRKIRADAILVEHGKGLITYGIADQNGADVLERLSPGMLGKLLERKVVEKFDTVQAMAAAYGIPLGTLQENIAQVNETVKMGKDEKFGRYISKEFKQLGRAPWYICECTPKVHHCMGGLVTTPEGRVVDIRTREPIPGLWAAGESTGGVHGAVRLGSCACLDCLVMGRSVGAAAAKS